MIPKKIYLFSDQRKQDVFEAALEYTGREDLTPEQLAPVFSLLEWIRSSQAQDPDRKTTELRACPFCGNASFSEHDAQGVHVKESERNTTGYGLPANPYSVFYVKCGRCGAQTGQIRTGYNSLTGNTTSPEEARKRAIDKWNRRAEENPNLTNRQ